MRDASWSTLVMMQTGIITLRGLPSIFHFLLIICKVSKNQGGGLLQELTISNLEGAITTKESESNK